MGDNINGPSVIRVPAWIKDPLGKYYMYFAHHEGAFVRLACADAVTGPWKIYGPGALTVGEARGFKGHIASPDVHVDHDKRRIRMYFHGPARKGRQATGIAFSPDGLHFAPSDEYLGNFYFRVFTWKGCFYAIAKNKTSGELLRSDNGVSPFTKISDILPRMRHSALLLHRDLLVIFYSRIGDAPERILVSTMRLKDDPADWAISGPREVLRPERDYEGARYPVGPSGTGAGTHACQLRDPFVFEEDERKYLFYCVAGESGIGVAEMSLEFNE
ncbi:MAG: hypothetical protein HZA16_03960 [Nitrospirae bacterium]|nr:hypothetical protein [Nitrospirota bacterium]